MNKKAKKLLAGIAAMTMLCCSTAGNFTASAADAPNPFVAKMDLLKMLMGIDFSSYTKII